MNINDLTLGQIKEIQAMTNTANIQDTHLEIGKSYLFRTVTHIYTGRVVSIKGNEVLIENGSWVADTGRYAQALEDTDNLKELEMFPVDKKVVIYSTSFMDVHQVDKLPTETK